MACNYYFTPRGERDRDRIVEYLAYDTSSPRSARRFADTLDATIERIRTFPRLYAVSRIPRLARIGYRVCFFMEYALIYRYVAAQGSNGDEGEDGADGGSIHIARIVAANSDYARVV